MQPFWRESTQENYDYALGVLPPIDFEDGHSFLVGEPMTHRVCTVTGDIRPTYEGWTYVDSKFYVATEDLTRPEFKARPGLTPDTIQ